MRKRILFLLILFYLFFFSGSYLLGKKLEEARNQEISGVQEQIEIPTIIPEAIPTPIPREEEILAAMSDEEKVGQLFIYGIEGNITLEPQNKQFLIDTKPGGIILFSKNITDENQLRTLIQEIQSTNPNIPLFISIDQEGGVVSRLKWNDTLTKSQESIATPQQAYDIARSRGEILKNLGINMNLAPVAEINERASSFMYKRAYKGNIDEIIRKVSSSVKGYKEWNIIPVLKHFPGHGDTNVDPHKTLPKIDITQEQWDSYILPFSKTIGENTVDAIMVGHILFPNISPEPATISKEIITNRLRTQLAYEGLIISDDMEMNALKSIDTPANIAKRSIESGVDILIYGKYTNDDKYSQRVAYNSILNEVKGGEMNIDDHVLRILRIKIKNGMF